MNMNKEIDFLLDTPDSIKSLVSGLNKIGARAHLGISGRYYQVGNLVYGCEEVFAAGVTKVGGVNEVVQPTINKEGYPVIENREGKMVSIGQTLHTHAPTEFQADGIPVVIKGLDITNSSEYEETVSMV